MSPGAKVFLTLASIGGIFGVLAIAASKKSNAASLPPGGTVVVPPQDGDDPDHVPGEPEGGFERDNPFSVPGVQDAAEASQILLRWWSSEVTTLAIVRTCRPTLAKRQQIETEPSALACKRPPKRSSITTA